MESGSMGLWKLIEQTVAALAFAFPAANVSTQHAHSQLPFSLMMSISFPSFLNLHFVARYKFKMNNFFNVFIIIHLIFPFIACWNEM